MSISSLNSFLSRNWGLLVGTKGMSTLLDTMDTTEIEVIRSTTWTPLPLSTIPLLFRKWSNSWSGMHSKRVRKHGWNQFHKIVLFSSLNCKPLITVVVTSFFWRIIMTYVFIGCGFVFWQYKIPERWFIGKVDILLSSHQIWHIFVMLGPGFLLLTSIKFLQYSHNNPCPWYAKNWN